MSDNAYRSIITVCADVNISEDGDYEHTEHRNVVCTNYYSTNTPGSGADVGDYIKFKLTTLDDGSNDILWEVIEVQHHNGQDYAFIGPVCVPPTVQTSPRCQMGGDAQ
jgi:hypothetical protein